MNMRIDYPKEGKVLEKHVSYENHKAGIDYSHSHALIYFPGEADNAYSVQHTCQISQNGNWVLKIVAEYKMILELPAYFADVINITLAQYAIPYTIREAISILHKEFEVRIDIPEPTDAERNQIIEESDSRHL